MISCVLAMAPTCPIYNSYLCLNSSSPRKRVRMWANNITVRPVRRKAGKGGKEKKQNEGTQTTCHAAHAAGRPGGRPGGVPSSQQQEMSARAGNRGLAVRSSKFNEPPLHRARRAAPSQSGPEQIPAPPVETCPSDTSSQAQKRKGL